MKKYKKFIEVNKDNLWEVLNVPIVKAIRKDIKEFGKTEDMPEPFCTSLTYRIEIQDKSYKAFGLVLALDICDNWHAYSKDYWFLHKDDEIL